MKIVLSLIFLTIALFSTTLHLATSTNPARLNPILATDSSSSEISGFLFNSLVKYDQDAKNIIGDLAQSFYFEDEKTLVFKLKRGVKWHDGATFSSQDVLFTYNTIISPNVSSPYSSSFRFVSSVEAVDEYTVVVRYKEPYFKALEIWMMGILPKHLLQDEPNIMSSKFNTAPIGTGAYKLTQFEHSKDIVLSAFDEYFESRAKIDKIVFHIIADPMTRFLMLKSGLIDIASLEPMQYEKQLDSDFFNKFNIIENISFSYTYLGFNLRETKFQDKKVREAISLAINRDELKDILFFSHAKVCSGPFLPDTKAFNDTIKPPNQNLLKAKELLREAGYDKQNPLTFEIATSNSNSIRPYAAQILQHQLKQVGIDVKLKIMEWQAFLNMVVFPRKFDTILLGWSLSPNPDPYMLWHSNSDIEGGFNIVGYRNKTLDSLIDKSQSTIDEDLLSKQFREMFKIIVDDDPYLFLFIPNSITAVSKKIKNVHNALGGIWHNYIEWEKSE